MYDIKKFYKDLKKDPMTINHIITNDLPVYTFALFDMTERKRKNFLSTHGKDLFLSPSVVIYIIKKYSIKGVDIILSIFEIFLKEKNHYMIDYNKNTLFRYILEYGNKKQGNKVIHLYKKHKISFDFFYDFIKYVISWCIRVKFTKKETETILLDVLKHFSVFNTCYKDRRYLSLLEHLKKLNEINQQNVVLYIIKQLQDMLEIVFEENRFFVLLLNHVKLPEEQIRNIFSKLSYITNKEYRSLKINLKPYQDILIKKIVNDYCNKKLILPNIKTLHYKNTKYIKYNACLLHIQLYMIILLRKYKDLCIPYTDFVKLTVVDSVKQYYQLDALIKDQAIDIHPQFYTAIILWHSKYHYFVPFGSKEAVAKTLKEYRYCFMHITMEFLDSNKIEREEKGLHSNLLLFDGKKKIAYRFDSVKCSFCQDYNELDKMIVKKIVPKDFTYYSPTDIFKYTQGFQTLNDDTEQNIYKMYGDIGGYCLSWSMWFVEFIIANSRYVDKIDKLFYSQWCFIHQQKNIQPFVQYIRNYANQLTKEKFKILDELKIPKNKQHMLNVLLFYDDKIQTFYSKILVKKLRKLKKYANTNH